jgi:hypothetical protein
MVNIYNAPSDRTRLKIRHGIRPRPIADPRNIWHFRAIYVLESLHHARYMLAPFATRIVLGAVVRLLAIGGCLVSMAVVAYLIIESEYRRLGNLSAFISRNKTS